MVWMFPVRLRSLPIFLLDSCPSPIQHVPRIHVFVVGDNRFSVYVSWILYDSSNLNSNGISIRAPADEIGPLRRLYAKSITSHIIVSLKKQPQILFLDQLFPYV